MDVADPQNRFTDIFRGKRWDSLRSAPTYGYDSDCRHLAGEK